MNKQAVSPKIPLLYVRHDIGNGKPIVLLHGMFADGSQWDTIAKLLSKDFRVIVVDLLGHGRSPRPAKATYSDKEHVISLRATLEALGAVSEATLVGYSMGGAVALAYSARYADSVEQLYLISTPFYLEPKQMIPNKYAGSILFTKASTGLFGFIERLLQKDGYFSNIVKIGNSSKKFHGMIGANDNVLEAEIIGKNLDQLVHRFDFVGHLKKLKAPLTFYAGKKDVFIVQSQLNALRQYHPFMDIQRLDIVKIDHMLVQNLPKEIVRLLHKNAANLLNIGIDQGKGKVVLLIHGIEGSSNYWTPLVTPLSENKRVIAVDLLGFGKSPKPLNIAYSLDDQVEWLKRTLDEHGIKKFEVVAHSLGSLVALKFASQYPSRVSRMTLFAPVFVPKKPTSSNQIINRLGFIDKLSDGSFLQSHTSQALGYKRVSRYVPFIRTVQNAIHRQDTVSLAKKASRIPTTIIYGERDALIDKTYLKKISRYFQNASVVCLKKAGHNFALFEPDKALHYGFPSLRFKNTPKKAEKLPPAFIKQLAKMAVPVLIGKSVLYFGAGILLFTSFAPWVVTLGLAFFVMRFGFEYIKGAFSLKNENLSYIGYILLGCFGIFLGYSLVRHPTMSLKISSLAISGLVLLAGLARVIVALAWIKKRHLRTSLLIGGILMSLVGVLALAGGIYSTAIIVYGLAIILIVRSVQFAVFSTTAIIFAFVRGFNR